MYISIRKSLYFYSFLAELNKFAPYGCQNQDHKENDDGHSQYNNNRVSRRNERRLKTVEHNKLLNRDGEAKSKENK